MDDLFDRVRQLLTGSYGAGQADLAASVKSLAASLDAVDIHIYLVDYAQVRLCPLLSDDEADPEEVPVEGTLAGRAFTTTTAYESTGNGDVRTWLPLMDGSQRLGVVEVVAKAEPSERLKRAYLATAAVLAQLVSTRRSYGDAIEHARRRLPMQLATEVIWGLLPPLTAATGEVAVAGILEPCYEVGGDVFDYAVNADLTHVALFDAVGHGVAASMLSTLAVNAYRNARRCGLDLVDTYRSIDKWIRAEYPDTFLTALLAELEPATGRYRRICAGHPTELLLRRGRLVRSLPGPTALPLGMGALNESWPEVTQEALEPGDWLLLYTDGVIEARSESGEFFGVDRLAAFLGRALADELPIAETMRRLIRAILDHQHEQLQDDATAVCVHWAGRAGSDPAG